jgi:hypothetical protein
MSVELKINDSSDEETFFDCNKPEVKELKTPMKRLIAKKLYYMDNAERVKDHNLNNYYLKTYGKTRDEIKGEKEITRKKKLELQLAKLQAKMKKLEENL